MKCPMRFRNRFLEFHTGDFVAGDCLKEDCAWWDLSLNLCCLRTIAVKLGNIDTVLGNIETVMPKNHQFRELM